MSPPAVTRRWLLRGALSGLAACAARGRIEVSGAGDGPFAELEARSGGQLGVAVLIGDKLIGNRLDERFAMCSTFKMPLAAVILQQVDQGHLSLEQSVPITREDLVFYSPVTEPLVEAGSASLSVLLQAAQKQSDNTATNLLLDQIGGPSGLTERLRALGDSATRLDRYEPEMNAVAPGEEHDTTTPAAMARLASSLLLGDVLSVSSRELLLQWMIDTATGAKRLRAGLLAGWRAGDKTGTGISEGLANRINDVAIAIPPDGPPRIIAAYYRTASYSPDVRDEDQAVLAEVGRIAASL